MCRCMSRLLLIARLVVGQQVCDLQCDDQDSVDLIMNWIRRLTFFLATDDDPCLFWFLTHVQPVIVPRHTHHVSIQWFRYCACLHVDYASKRVNR